MNYRLFQLMLKPEEFQELKAKAEETKKSMNQIVREGMGFHRKTDKS